MPLGTVRRRHSTGRSSGNTVVRRQNSGSSGAATVLLLRRKTPKRRAFTANGNGKSVADDVSWIYQLFCAFRGRVAQLGERLVRNEEVAGSIPVSSTKIPIKTRFFSRAASRTCPAF